MENRKEFTFPSANGRTAIHAVGWHPTGEPAGILQIAHGVAEYALRYEPFARFLNAHGFLVVANDHLGHGESVAEGAPQLYFGEKGSWQHVVDDMYTLRCRTGEAYPELPYFIMGHSMGSFLTRTYLIRYPGTVKGAIMMGTGQNPDAMLVGGKASPSSSKSSCRAPSPHMTTARGKSAARRSQAYWQGRSGARTRATSWKSSPSAPTTRPSRLTARATTG